MPIHATLLVLASALLHALWNALLKREKDVDVAAVGVLGAAAIFAGGYAVARGGDAFASPSAFGWGLGAGAFEGAYFVTLALALRRASLGAAYAVARGGALLVVWPVSVLWLGERLSALSAGGAAVVALGLVAVGWRRDARSDASGLAWAAACACCVAGYHLCYKRALGEGARPAALFAVALALALAINLVWLGRANLPRLAASFRARGALLGGAGLVCCASFLIFLSALDLGGAGAVVTLRNSSIVFAQALGWLLGERPGPAQLVGVGLVTAGAAALGWPA